MRQSAIFWIGINLLAIACLATMGPAEKSLGLNVRVVYLHGAWVWTALIAFFAAGVVGLLGLIIRDGKLQYWSRALGRTGLLFWITYLPISLWAMQTNWNGMFLAEPRFRVAVVFAIGGLLLQIGVTIADHPAWAAAANAIFGSTLFIVLRNTQDVMHPASPILDSNAWRIQLFFFGLVALSLLLAYQIALLLFRAERNRLSNIARSRIQPSQAD